MLAVKTHKGNTNLLFFDDEDELRKCTHVVSTISTYCYYWACTTNKSCSFCCFLFLLSYFFFIVGAFVLMCLAFSFKTKTLYLYITQEISVMCTCAATGRKQDKDLIQGSIRMTDHQSADNRIFE